MRILERYVRAFGRGYTYDVRRNSYLWLGALSGLLILAAIIGVVANLPASSIRTYLAAVQGDDPVHLVLLLHPGLLGVLFGAMGTIRRDLEAENARLMDSLKMQAITDPLTGLYNRRFMKEFLKNMLEAGHRSRKPFAVVLIDLDGFKGINEEYGHARGDRVLVLAADALRSSLRGSDVVGRHGGDEFLLLSPDVDSSGQGLVNRAVEEMHARTGLSLSAGMASWPEDGQTADTLLAMADARLAVSKKKSRETRRLRALVA